MPTMSSGEFDIIRRYFRDRQPQPAALRVAIGDDAAVLDWPAQQQLVVTMDTLNVDVHFPRFTAAADIAWKTLAVNASDLAAMGAVPRYFTLSLCLPAIDERWLAEFSTGLFAAAETCGMTLIGGDTTRGPLSLSVCAFGALPAGRAVTRAGARAGDLIYVTGTLGDAALGLRQALGDMPQGDGGDYLLQRLQRPTARLAIGAAAADVASAMIDVSDGLAADLGHILHASDVGASVRLADLPLSAPARATLPTDELQLLALTGGDDYELCMTVPPAQAAAWEQRARAAGWPLTAIGCIEAEAGLRLRRADGSLLLLQRAGYQHFSADTAGELKS